MNRRKNVRLPRYNIYIYVCIYSREKNNLLIDLKKIFFFYKGELIDFSKRAFGYYRIKE